MFKRFSVRASTKKPAQALVELALSITFIFFLLAAAVDLGLMYKAYQTLENATAEASSYLAKTPITGSCGTATGQTCLNTLKGNADAVAIGRLRFEDNETHLSAVGSLRDLNGNGLDDQGGDGWTTEAAFASNDYIHINEMDGSWIVSHGTTLPNFTSYTPSQQCQNREVSDPNLLSCYIVVRARIVYHPFFALAPLIGGSTVNIRAYAVKPITR